MDQAFWNERWQAGQIAFHQPTVNPHLVQHADALLPAGPGRVLVPLCGKTQDLAWLRQRGHEVWGVEFIEQAARAFFAERGVEPEELRVGGQLALHREGITIVVGDFFGLQAAPLGGPFPAAFDRGALVAIPPERRRSYLETLRRLSRDDARLLLICFEHDLASGPPFPIPAAELAPLCQGLFTLAPLADVDILESEPRFKDRGATYMRETVWLATAA